jgi:hypothetical protein
MTKKNVAFLELQLFLLHIILGNVTVYILINVTVILYAFAFTQTLRHPAGSAQQLQSAVYDGHKY